MAAITNTKPGAVEVAYESSLLDATKGGARVDGMQHQPVARIERSEMRKKHNQARQPGFRCAQPGLRAVGIAMDGSRPNLWTFSLTHSFSKSVRAAGPPANS